MERIINVTYYDLANSVFKPNKGERERVTVYYCDNCENCEAYKNKTCVMLNRAFFHRCPYGTKDIIEGYTKSSKKCGQLIQEYKMNFKDKIYALKPIKHIEKCGDYIFLNLIYLESDDKIRDINNEYERLIGIEIHNKVEYSDMIKEEYFTPEFICRLIDFRPETKFGGPITNYYEKYIPQFCYDLRKYFKDLYEATRKIKPEIEELANTVSNIGKKAILKTLNHGKVRVGSYIADWDGEKLVTDSRILMILSNNFDDAQVIIIPTDNTIVEIVDDDTVNDYTEFV